MRHEGVLRIREREKTPPKPAINIIHVGISGTDVIAGKVYVMTNYSGAFWGQY